MRPRPYLIWFRSLLIARSALLAGRTVSDLIRTALSWRCSLRLGSPSVFGRRRGGYFLVSHYKIVWDDGGAPNYGVMYWGYDSAAKKFRTHFFNDQGPYDEAGSTYEGVVADGKLTFTGPARFQYELDEDGKIKVNPDGTITVVWWLRDSKGAWKFWRNATYTKIKEDV